MRALEPAVERWLTEETGDPLWSHVVRGRPVLVTANDYGLGIYNGDAGVTMDGRTALRACIAAQPGPLDFATSRLGNVETMHAMTIHKARAARPPRSPC